MQILNHLLDTYSKKLGTNAADGIHSTITLVNLVRVHLVRLLHTIVFKLSNFSVTAAKCVKAAKAKDEADINLRETNEKSSIESSASSVSAIVASSSNYYANHPAYHIYNPIPLEQSLNFMKISNDNSNDSNGENPWSRGYAHRDEETFPEDSLNELKILFAGLVAGMKGVSIYFYKLIT